MCTRPLELSSAEAALRACSSRSQSATWAPESSSLSAIAFPIPCAPPVIAAQRPLRSILFIISAIPVEWLRRDILPGNRDRLPCRPASRVPHKATGSRPSSLVQAYSIAHGGPPTLLPARRDAAGARPHPTRSYRHRERAPA